MDGLDEKQVGIMSVKGIQSALLLLFFAVFAFVFVFVFFCIFLSGMMIKKRAFECRRSWDSIY